MFVKRGFIYMHEMAVVIPCIILSHTGRSTNARQAMVCQIVVQGYL